MGRRHSKHAAPPAPQIIYKTVETVVTKELNPLKDKFERLQAVLARFAEAHLTRLQQAPSCVCPMAQSGSGKTTVSNIFFGTNWEAKASATDVTQFVTGDPVYVELLKANLVDFPGFPPSLLTIGRAFLLYMHTGCFPDWVLHPCPNDRIVEVVELYPIIKEGFLSLVIFPFNSKMYYKSRDVLQLSHEKAVQLATEKGTKEDIEAYLRVAQIDTHAQVAYDAQFPLPQGSMKSKFINSFFNSQNKWIQVSYEQHMDELKELSAIAIIRAALITAVEHIEKSTSIDAQGMISDKTNHLAFLK